MVLSGVLELGNEFHISLFKDYSKWTRQGQRSLEQSLHMAVKAWYSECSGVPNILYFLPEQLGSMDCTIPVSR